MVYFSLDDNVIFHDKDPFAQPLFVDKDSRVLRFALKPGQSVREHTAPHSPVYIVVLKGHGLFSGEQQQERRVDTGGMIVFGAGEAHAIQAQDEDLIFVAILHGAPGAQ